MSAIPIKIVRFQPREVVDAVLQTDLARRC